MSIQDRPVLESAMLAPLGGLVARGGSDLVARALLGMTMLGKGDPAKERAFARMQSGKGYKAFKNILTGLGTVAGAAYPMVKTYNPKLSLSDNLSKYWDKGQFYKDRPGVKDQEAISAILNPPQAVATGSVPSLDTPFRSGRSIGGYKEASVRKWDAICEEIHVESGLRDLLTRLDKVASSGEDIPEDLLREVIGHGQVIDKEAFYSTEPSQFEYDFNKKNIPVHQGRQLINRDPFLTEHNKASVDYLMRNSGEGDSGSISGKDVAQTAAKAGLGLVTGIAFGKTLGNLFSMGTAQTNRLSNIGAVAGALYNTGIFSEKV
jgi:hypothetical protein